MRPLPLLQTLTASLTLFGLTGLAQAHGSHGPLTDPVHRAAHDLTLLAVALGAAGLIARMRQWLGARRRRAPSAAPRQLA